MLDANGLLRFRDSLQQQRRALTSWFSRAQAPKRQVRLGPAGETQLQSHLRSLDTAIAQAEEGTLGRCRVCGEYVESGMLEMDYTCCVCLEHITGDERRRLEQELELSAKVQQALLPKEDPRIPRLEVAAFSRPAHVVGGDYFDFFRFRDGGHGIVVGDVAGHGMSASLLMASLQAALRTLALDHDAPADVARRLNQLFYHNIRMTNFVTLFLARFEPETRTLTYCNAGHNPPLLARRTSNGGDPVQWLRPTGAAIGLVETVECGTAAVQLAPGDVLLLYTDGLTETTNARLDEFGETRLLDAVQEGIDLPVQALLTSLRTRVRTFSGNAAPADDMTVVGLRVL